MTRIILTIALCLSLITTSFAQETREPGIEQIISNQLEAFKQDDFETAFTFASPNIRNLFQTPQNFGSMVRQGYPMVWRPSDVTYLERRTISGAIWQKVQIKDAAGATHLLDYQMVMTESGWRINGVQLLQKPDVGV
ncbi:DUF4864 domain-containing protein [Parasulfitobacter algicola]|uniref:DUF4864 domain-containing protein n=1 Tax=Parasulfitobacter algicola TaxID=2614809 RepID=A0ABX2IZP5_9RHOB|nr:DUF4864 domain-containing protein [Sulfitobacter algicola]NSX55853.1 DUF4864 domain-containing protein [Sulfitobacter algicola]